MNFRSSVLLTTLFILGTSLLACDYGRMKDQEAVQTYKIELPEMPENTLPTTGGIQVIKESSPDKLHNPLPQSARGSGPWEGWVWELLHHVPRAQI